MYVHVPFCARRCPYCDFTVVVSSKPPVDAYHAALGREIDARRASLDGRRLRSVYFGGGTPSVSGTKALTETLATILSCADGSPEEVTLEVNPEDRARLDFDRLRAAGFDRVSLGAQSFDRSTLALLGRQHVGRDIDGAVEAARRAGFEAISVDLIHGVPDQPVARLQHDLERIVSLGIDHVSVYELTIEAKTSFDRRRRRGEMTPLSEHELMEETAQIELALRTIGVERYEVSSYARPGREAVHNSGYWRGFEYLGVGVGAHSLCLVDGVAERRHNTASIRSYLTDPHAGAMTDRLSSAEFLSELLLTGMRTTEGVDVSALKARFLQHASTLDGLALNWQAAGWATFERGRARPTSKGLSLADSIASDAIEALLSERAVL